METRTIKFDFVKGEIKATWLNAQLDSIYKRIFQNSQRSARRNPLEVDHGIKVIIFGCFWLEALCNNFFREMLKLESKRIEYGVVIWSKLRRSNFFDKLEIISTFTTPSQRNKYIEILPGLRKIFELRNRLAHFKDEDKKLTEAISKEEVLMLIADHPIPDITQELMWSKVGEHADTISKTSIWLNLIYKSFCHSHGVIISSKKIMGDK